MSFRTRVIAISSLLALLIAAFLLGMFLSPERAQESAVQEPLLPIAALGDIAEAEIVHKGTVEVTLRRKDGGWEALTAGHAYPGSADRIEAFVRGVAGLKRGRIVGSDRGGLLAELGLGEDSARLLVLRRGTGKGEMGLLVGKRGPSGDEDYMQVKGTDAVYLVRGSLAFFLTQDRTYWYELHVLPDDARGGAAISRISVTGRLALGGSEGGMLQGSYTLRRGIPADSLRRGIPADSLTRGTGERDGEWTMPGEKRHINQMAASGMANSLSLLEAVDFAEQTGGGAGGSGGAGESGKDGGLRVEVSTQEGKTYSFLVRPGPRAGQYLVTTSWSAWTYILDELPLRRAVPLVSELLLQ